MAAAAAPAPLQLGALLENVHPGWVRFLEETGLAAAAQAALDKAGPDVDQLAPARELIFEYLRYFGPDDTLAVIVGQDPYPQDAQGVCFSIPHLTPLKGSLKPIIANLERARLAKVHSRARDDSSSGKLVTGDLRSWAAQGVLLMNAAPTNRVGARGAHRAHWKRFTAGFVRELSARAAARGRPLVFMLWGGDARALAKEVRHGGETSHLVYEWTHPSPMINNRLAPPARFEQAPHFSDANAALREQNLRPVEWDPLAHTYAFTDGACQRNGAANADASYAALVLSGPLRKVEISGRVAPREYRLADAADPLAGFAPADAPAVPTNNRGEYLAWCWVLLLLLRGGVRGRVDVVSDCNLFIQTMTEWLPARRRRNAEAELKNFDLVTIADVLLAALRKEIGLGDDGVRLVHVHSHQTKPPVDAGPESRVFWYGNDQADKIATSVLAPTGAGAGADTGADVDPGVDPGAGAGAGAGAGVDPGADVGADTSADTDMYKPKLRTDSAALRWRLLDRYG